MKRKRSKFLAVMMIAFVLLTTVACQGETTTTTTSSVSGTTTTTTTGSGTTQSTTQPTNPGQLVTEPTTISIGLPQSTLITDYEDNDFTRFIQDKTGLTIEFELYPSQDASQKLEIMVNGGSELPDTLMGFGLTDAAVLNYGSNGVFIDLKDYFEEGLATNFEYAMTTITEEMSPEELLVQITSTDGGIYAYPRYGSEIYNQWPNRWYIQQTWLNAVGKDVPTTTDELYDVLVAFRDQDPNQNNKADEIPMLGCQTNQTTPERMIMNSFIYWSPGTYLNVEASKLSVPFTTDEWREGLRYLNKLCSEDLLNPLSYTMDNAQYKTYTDLPEGQTTIVGIWMGAPSQSFDNNVNYKRRNEYVGMPPMTGPNGVKYSPYNPPTPGYAAHVTSFCDDPELAFRFFDNFWDIETSIRGRFGVEGKNWNWASEGQKSLFEQVGVDIKASITQDITVWGQTNNTLWTNVNPYFIPSWIMDGIVVDATGEVSALPMIARLVGQMVGLRPDEVVPRLKYSEDEVRENAELDTVIKTYVNESMVRFIVGDLDINDNGAWENYLNELNSMNLNRWIELAQQAYDRMTK